MNGLQSQMDSSISMPESNISSGRPFSLEPNNNQILENLSSPQSSNSTMWQYVVGFLLLAVIAAISYYFFAKSSASPGSSYGLIALLGDIVKKTTNMGATGTTEVSTGIASAIDSGVDAVDKAAGEKSAVPSMKIDDPYLDATEHSPDIVPDDTLNQSKTRYCFIGTANGVRSCARVSKGTKCMSGEIFPSLNVCINPSLRV